MWPRTWSSGCADSISGTGALTPLISITGRHGSKSCNTIFTFPSTHVQSHPASCSRLTEQILPQAQTTSLTERSAASPQKAGVTPAPAFLILQPWWRAWSNEKEIWDRYEVEESKKSWPNTTDTLKEE